MANICEFELKIKGLVGNDGVEKIIAMCDLADKEVADRPSFEGMYDATMLVNETINGRYVHICGNCNWSVSSSFLDEISKIAIEHRLNLEIMSWEPGMGFSEHYYFEDGMLWTSDSEDYCEFHIDDIEQAIQEEYEDEIFCNKVLSECSVTKDNYQSFADEDGYIKLGGFGENDWKIKE